MALKDRIDVQFHKAFLSVYIGGRPLDALSAIIEHGYDTVSAAARLMLPAVPDHVRVGQKVEVRAGWDGFVIPIFNGWLEDDGRGYFPFDGEMRAAGYMKRTQYQYPDELTYEDETDATIVIDLLDKAGASRQAGIDGSGTTLGTVKAVKLEAGTPTFELINRIDQVFGYKTFDTPGGIVRKKVSGIPAANVVWSYAEGDNILRIYRNRTLRGIHNRIVVTGLPQDSGTPSSAWEADNPLVPDPPGHISFDFRSDLIESDSVASDVAERLLGEKNRVLEDLVIEVAGNPYLAPGMTVGITSGRMGLDSETPYRIAHVSHLLDPSGFISRVTVEGGVGQAGYEVPGDGTSGVNPQAVIDYRVDYETFDDGGGSDNYYTVDANGNASMDNDGAPGSLTYSWSNDTNADTSTAETYATAFTAAELAGGPVISLEVTDADGNTDTATATIADDGSTPITQRELFVAADSRAEATADGGANWNTWTPGSGTVVSTPEIAPEGVGWYGLSGGELYKTTDYLATSPTLVNTFDAQVNVIWVNEADTQRITVGLDDGSVHRSVDGGTTWTELREATGSGGAETHSIALFSDDTDTTDEIVNTATHSHSFSLSASGTQTVSEEWWIILAPPANAVRFRCEVTVSASYENDTEGTGSNSSDWDYDLYDGTPNIDINRTDDENFVSPSLGNESTSNSYFVEWTWTGSGDWPNNHDDLNADPPDAEDDEDPYIRIEMKLSVATTGEHSRTADFAQSLRVTEIELDDGTVYAPGTPIHWLIESAQNPGEYRIAAEDAIVITFDDFANESDLITWSGGTARWGALSFFSNYGAATHTDEVKREDGTVITGIDSADVRAITHHIRDDILYAADLDGSDADTYAKAAGATAFTAAGTITGAGQPNHMIRDGDSPQVIYLAAANGLYKTYDGATSWVQMRDYSGAGLAGNQVGYGSAPWQGVTGETVVSDTTANDSGVAALGLWDGSSNDDPPDGWRDVGFDDSGWSSAVEVSDADFTPLSGTKSIAAEVYAETSNEADAGEENLIRHTFTLSAGQISSATLTIRVEDLLLGAWVNNVFVGQDRSDPGEGADDQNNLTITVDPSLLVADGDNILAFHFANQSDYLMGISYELEVN